MNILPVIHPAITLRQLGAEIGCLASEQKIVLGCDSKRVAHERHGVYRKRAGHRAGDTVDMKIWLSYLSPFFFMIFSAIK